MGFPVIEVEFEDCHLADIFEVMCLNLSKLLAKCNFEIAPYEDENLIWFSQLPSADKKRIIQDVSDYIYICSSEYIEKGTLSNSTSFVWRGLNEMGLKFTSDMFGHIKNDQIVEVYSLENKQIFRNLNFFDYVSYTLEELFCRPWTDLFHRPDIENTARIVDVIQSVVGTKTSYFNNNQFVKDHLCEERGSQFEMKVTYKLKSMFPVFSSNKQVSGYLAVEEAEIL